MAGVCAAVDNQVKPCRITDLKQLIYFYSSWKVKGDQFPSTLHAGAFPLTLHVCVNIYVSTYMTRSVVRTEENKHFHCQMCVSTWKHLYFEFMNLQHLYFCSKNSMKLKHATVLTFLMLLPEKYHISCKPRKTNQDVLFQQNTKTSMQSFLLRLSLVLNLVKL